MLARGVSGRLFYKTGISRKPYAAFTPDIFVDDDGFSLEPYGVPGKVVSTLDHTQGSISVTLASGDALVGDLVASGILIGGVGMARFHLGHGGPLPAAEVRRHATQLARG